MALLALHADKKLTGPETPITMPENGLTFEETVELGELYVCILDFITADGRISELITIVRDNLNRLNRLQGRLAPLWNSSKEHRVCYAHKFLVLLNDLTHAHAMAHDQWAHKDERRIRVYVRSYDGPREVTLVNLAYPEGTAIVCSAADGNVSVLDTTTEHSNEFHTAMTRGFEPILRLVPAEVYPAGKTSTTQKTLDRHSDPAGDNLGKNDSKKPTAKTPQIAELLRTKDGAKLAVKDKLLSLTDGKAPTVTMSNGKSKELCLRSCGTTLGPCLKGKRCGFYHFHPNLQKVPEGEDLSDVRRYLAIASVSALIEPTELGKTVLGMQ